ncbi:SDR family NAD(P)-dependent oxidoreductase [Pseudomaricurvus alkylphenolicus]|uniref:SDR family NAD(P)-dependent oxidoreductase n=1 Tax=Pseudomaricurvus alkylphenolicus TaxID=1306991 RepID=UPI001421937A|nr:SDR family NAD(P)-dependent oxidoreductase [Pseudomaricurvus alkylphenolicus]NIB39163.1 SDR family NAD(P)-dependent oxidoreductase [Pseudomaricurvus alkylphenolicus]
MKPLQGKVALVTGASRGIGKGIALSLGEAGATVYVTGRTVKEGKSAACLPGTIYQTAQEVTELGGVGIAIQCDHCNDSEVETLFQRISTGSEKLNILVNNVWGGYQHFTDGTEFWNERGFWTQPISRWDSMFQAGVRAHYVSSLFAVPLLRQADNPLMITTSFFASQRNDKGVAYGVAKAASDRMVACMAEELREHGVAVVSLYPGIVRTESVMKAAEHLDLSNSESPQFVGRAVVALATDDKVLEKSGRVLIAAELAQEYGFTDIDGSQPQALKPEDI